MRARGRIKWGARSRLVDLPDAHERVTGGRDSHVGLAESDEGPVGCRGERVVRD